MKIVVLTNGSQHGLRIIKELRNSGLKICAIVLEKKSLGKRELNEFKSKLGSLSFIIKLIPFKKLLYQWFRKYKYSDVTKEQLEKYTDQVKSVDNFNGEDCTEFLKSLSPDLLILGGSRIIKPNVLEIPRIGTLNAHPGLLPEYRGVDVIKWALYNDDPIGVTVHFVNSGIDTGEICSKRELFKSGYRVTIDEAKEKAEKLAAEMMTEVVGKYYNQEVVDCIPNNEEDGDYYRKMSPEKERELIDKLK